MGKTVVRVPAESFSGERGSIHIVNVAREYNPPGPYRITIEKGNGGRIITAYLSEKAVRALRDALVGIP